MYIKDEKECWFTDWTESRAKRHQDQCTPFQPLRILTLELTIYLASTLQLTARSLAHHAASHHSKRKRLATFVPSSRKDRHEEKKRQL